jgi:hypothetical protein
MRVDAVDLPVFLCEMISKLMERSIKGFPVKKLLLMFWKTLIVSLGGTRGANDLRDRRSAHKGLITNRGALCKTTFPDYSKFCQEMSDKYPFYAPEPLDTAYNRRLYDLPPTPATSAIPIRKKLFANPALSQYLRSNSSTPFVFPFTNDSGYPRALEEAAALMKSSLHESLWTRDLIDVAVARRRELKGLVLRTPGVDKRTQDFEEEPSDVELFYACTLKGA